MTIRKLFVPVFLLISVLFAFAGAARASDISVFVGAEMPGSIEGRPLDNGPVYGIRFGSNFIRYLGLEHTLAISPDFMFPQRLGGISEDMPPNWEESKGFIYSSNMMLNFPDIDSRMVPFLTAGVGLIHQYGDRKLPVGTKLAFNYGGGVKFPNLAGPLGARADFRGYRAGVISKSVNLFELSFGLMVSFGR